MIYPVGILRYQAGIKRICFQPLAVSRLYRGHITQRCRARRVRRADGSPQRVGDMAMPVFRVLRLPRRKGQACPMRRRPARVAVDVENHNPADAGRIDLYIKTFQRRRERAHSQTRPEVVRTVGLMG